MPHPLTGRLYPGLLAALKDLHEPEPTEEDGDYLQRLVDEEKVVTLPHAIARDPREYRKAWDRADKADVPLAIIPPPEPEEPTGPTHSITREQAKDPAVYRRAKAAAEKDGAQLVIEGAV